MCQINCGCFKLSKLFYWFFIESFLPNFYHLIFSFWFSIDATVVVDDDGGIISFNFYSIFQAIAILTYITIKHYWIVVIVEYSKKKKNDGENFFEINNFFLSILFHFKIWFWRKKNTIILLIELDQQWLYGKLTYSYHKSCFIFVITIPPKWNRRDIRH